MNDTKQKLLNTGAIFNDHGSPWEVLLFLQANEVEGYFVMPKTGPGQSQVYFFKRENHSIQEAERQLNKINDAGDRG